MGVTLCSKHGRSSVAFACAHLRARRDPLLGGLRVVWSMPTGSLSEDVIEFALCAECASKASISLDDHIAPSGALLDILNHLAGMPECARCEEERWDRSSIPVVELRDA